MIIRMVLLFLFSDAHGVDHLRWFVRSFVRVLRMTDDRQTREENKRHPHSVSRPIDLIYVYPIAPTPAIEIIEDDSEPADEGDMSFLTDVLEQYNQNFREQGLRTRMSRELLAHDNILRSTVLRAQILSLIHLCHDRRYGTLSFHLDNLQTQPTTTAQPSTDAKREGKPLD